jgi:hypothetical protein
VNDITRTSKERLLQIAETIERRPVLGHWPHMRAATDAEFLRKLSRDPPASEAALQLARKALEHLSPEQCWATGPATGNVYQDLFVCPGCTAIAAIDEALSTAHEPPAEPVGFVPRRKSDGYIASDLAAPGERYELNSAFEWVPVYLRPAQPSPSALQSASPPSLGERETATSQIPSARGDITASDPRDGSTPPPSPSHPDTDRLDWLEQARLRAVPFSERSRLDEGMEYLWWQIVDGKKSVSGHPLATLREAIDAARHALTKGEG